MKLLSIEPTPSPHTMKLNIDESLPPGRKHTYLKENLEHAPEPIRSILSIEGVKSVFHTADFLAVDRMPKGDWRADTGRHRYMSNTSAISRCKSACAAAEKKSDWPRPTDSMTP